MVLYFEVISQTDEMNLIIMKSMMDQLILGSLCKGGASWLQHEVTELINDFFGGIDSS